ncbi:MAG: MraY family glycosyltransferase [Burkholderiaceae bacterium]
MAALLAFALLAAPLRGLARRYGWVDKPDHRKVHRAPVPLTGGIGVVLASAGSLLAFGQWSTAIMGLVVGALMIFAVAFADDRFPIRARYRFAAQAAGVAVAMLCGPTWLPSLGELLWRGEFALGWLGVPFTLIAMTGVINSVNMTDGADGLAGGLALGALVWFGVVFGFVAQAAPETDAARVLPIIAALIGALIGFLAFNLRTPWRARAAIFMGDGGSMMLGFVLAWMAVRAAGSYGDAGMPPVVAIWILAVPLVDTISCMLRRVQDGVTPMSPDHRHVHHLVQSCGLSVRAGVFLLHGVALACGAVGVIGWHAGGPDYVLFWAWLAMIVAYHLFALRHWHDKPNLMAPLHLQASKRQRRAARRAQKRAATRGA